MRALKTIRSVAALVLVALLAPAAARAQTATPVAPSQDYVVEYNMRHLSARECRKIARQMIRYDRDIQLASRWSGSSYSQELRIETLDRKLDMLAERWDKGCDLRDEIMLAKLYDYMKKAGKLALRYFTMGMF
jgi:hypothetical protein